MEQRKQSNAQYGKRRPDNIKINPRPLDEHHPAGHRPA
jgi:hypothetical protein